MLVEKCHQFRRGAVVGHLRRGEPFPPQHRFEEELAQAHALAPLVDVEVQAAQRLDFLEGALNVSEATVLMSCNEEPLSTHLEQPECAVALDDQVHPLVAEVGAERDRLPQTLSNC